MTPVDVWSGNQIDAAIMLADGASALLAGLWMVADALSHRRSGHS
jgi:hypothetical protein